MQRWTTGPWKAAAGRDPDANTNLLRNHTESYVSPLRPMKPDLTESLMSAFTVEGQCEHILVHTERPLLSSPNTFAGRRAGEEAWEEIM